MILHILEFMQNLELHMYLASTCPQAAAQVSPKVEPGLMGAKMQNAVLLTQLFNIQNS